MIIFCDDLEKFKSSNRVQTACLARHTAYIDPNNSYVDIYTMSDLQSMHTQARKLILMLSAGVERLETAEQVIILLEYEYAMYPLLSSLCDCFHPSLQATRAPVPDGFAADLQKQLSQLQKLSVDMDGLWRMQSLREAASKRDLWKRKVEQIADEADALRTALDRCGQRQHRKLTDEAHRQELLQRRADGRPTMDLGADAAARKSIHNSKAVVEEAYITGVGVLGAMSGQRDRLKSAHRKVLDVLNAVGLSDSVLRVAERRIAIDKLIAYGGMVVITLLLIFLYWRLKA